MTELETMALKTVEKLIEKSTSHMFNSKLNSSAYNSGTEISKAEQNCSEAKKWVAAILKTGYQIRSRYRLPMILRKSGRTARKPGIAALFSVTWLPRKAW